jgi:hypothetical protein
MVICDLCKRDPGANEKNEALKREPWGVILAPPLLSGLAEKRLCWACAMRVFEAWLDLVEGVEALPTPK